MNLAYFQRNVRLLIEGIQIKDFSKLSNDPEFIEACKLYASMIKNDNDAKAKFDLYDLDKYKQNLQGFIGQVQQAYQYISGQRQFNKLLKKPLPKGVNLVYKDKNV